MSIISNQVGLNSLNVKANAQNPNAQVENFEKQFLFNTFLTQANKIEDNFVEPIQTNDDTVLVNFTDSLYGYNNESELSDDTLYNLEYIFGKDDIQYQEDGTVQLQGDVESFVSKWHEGISYIKETLNIEEYDNNDISNNEPEDISHGIDIQISMQKDGTPKDISLLAYNKESQEQVELNKQMISSDEFTISLNYDSTNNGKTYLNDLSISSGNNIDKLTEQDLHNLNINTLDLSMNDLDKFLGVIASSSQIVKGIEDTKITNVLDKSLFIRKEGTDEIQRVSSEDIIYLYMSRNS